MVRAKARVILPISEFIEKSYQRASQPVKRNDKVPSCNINYYFGKIYCGTYKTKEWILISPKEFTLDYIHELFKEDIPKIQIAEEHENYRVYYIKLNEPRRTSYVYKKEYYLNCLPLKQYKTVKFLIT